jgi:hypothetical protein
MKQTQALDILKTGANIFLTGAPGAGKTYVLNQYIDYLRGHDIPAAVTASTGIAATHIGGVTIHSWSGLGIKKKLDEWEIDAMQERQYLWKRYEKTKVLIIDEISMLDAQTFATLDQVCKAFKRNEKPFGGMQIVVVGDFFQLPPISRNGEEPALFAFESPAWRQANLLACYIGEQHRQDDDDLLDILSRIRAGDVEDGFYQLEDRSVFEQDMTVDDGTGPMTHLYTHNADVDQLNQQELDALETEEQFYTMATKGSAKNVERLIASCLSPEALVLKIGALVMCTKNNFEEGYANGTLGTVIDFDEHDEYPIIMTRDGREITITPTTWAMHDGEKVMASIEQIPLRLAWAITVHKSQGMSLDAARMDLSNVFEYGQGYVALSRVRTLDGLYLGGFNQQALMVHPKVKAKDEQFQKKSDALRDYTETKTPQDLSASHEKFIINSGGSLEKKEISEQSISTSSTHDQTKELLLESKTINEIAKERNLTSDTVVQHIQKLLDAREITTDVIVYLKPKKKDLDAIVKAFADEHAETGKMSLTPVKTKLKDKYSYEELKVGRLFVEATDTKE